MTFEEANDIVRRGMSGIGLPIDKKVKLEALRSFEVKDFKPICLKCDRSKDCIIYELDNLFVEQCAYYMNNDIEEN